MIHRASGLGGCLKSQIAAALGMKPIPVDEMSALRMGEGQLHEDDVVARLVMDGATVMRQQEEVAITSDGNYGSVPLKAEVGLSTWAVLGHIDGVVITDVGGPRLLEIKSMGDSPWKMFQAKRWDTGGLIDKYKWQASIYMHCLNMEMLFVTKNRNSGQITQHGVEMPFYSLDQIAERVSYIEDHVARHDIQGARCDSTNTWFCLYRDRICDTTPKTVAPESSLPKLDVAMTTQLALSEYAALSDKIRALQATVASDVKTLEAEQKVLKPIIQEGLASVVPNQKYQLNGYEVTWVEQPVAASVRRFVKIKKVED